MGRRLRRWVVRLAVILGLPLAALVAALWLWLASSLPDYTGQIALDGLKAPVEILRDRHGVPHIFAKTDADALFALGFVHAQDRLWQMETLRRAGEGRLSEVFGAETLRLDRFVRTLGLARIAEAHVEALDPEARALLDAYTAGVNAFLHHHKGAWPPEFTLLGISPEPWRPADSLVWGGLMALELSGHWRTSLLRARLAQRLSPAEIDQLWPPYPESGPTTLAAAARDYRGLPLAPLTRLAAAFDGHGASNAWVVDGAHSATGKPLLANDPHLHFGLPILWYLVTIEAPDLHLAGATVAGVPFVVLGRSDRIAWGMTTTGGSVEDLYIERVDPKDPTRYLTPDGSRRFRTRAEVILVRGKKPVTLTVRETRHGPVLSDTVESLAAAAERGTVIALAAPWLDPANRTADAVFQLDRARDWTEFTAALKDFAAPEQNLMYADVDGNIGFYAAGTVPIRKQGEGRTPVPGWNGDYDWTGAIPFDALPHGFNPADGHFVNANNRVTPPNYPYVITRDGWDAPYRAERITALLGATPKASLDSFAAIQADSVSLAARELLPLMTAIEPSDPEARDLVARLKAWDGTMDRSRVEPLVFVAWLRELNRGLFSAKLGRDFAPFWSLRPELIKSVLTAHPSWCGDGANPEPADCRAQLEAALTRALAWLKNRYGSDPASWHWGDAHMAQFRHTVFQHLPVLGRFIDIEFPADGGDYTVNRGAFDTADERRPFADIHGAGYRALYDLADLGRSRFVIATGESGNPMSRHFRDFVPLWRDFAYVRLDQTRAALAADNDGALVLTPRQP